MMGDSSSCAVYVDARCQPFDSRESTRGVVHGRSDAMTTWPLYCASDTAGSRPRLDQTYTFGSDCGFRLALAY